MPRRPRIHINEVPLHIEQRGHNRQRCCFAEEDSHPYMPIAATLLIEAQAQQLGRNMAARRGIAS